MFIKFIQNINVARRDIDKNQPDVLNNHQQ